MARRGEQSGTLLLEGLAAAPGIGIGVAVVWVRTEPVFPEYSLHPDRIETEIERFERAARDALAQIDAIRRPLVGVEIVDSILSTQAMILEDRQLRDDVARRVRSERINAEWALGLEMRRLDRLFAEMEDAYLRERRADVRDAARRLLLNLLGHEPDRLVELRGPAVIVASDLSPAEVSQLDRERVAGIVTEAGGRTSHTAIVATSLGLPTVVGVDGATARIGDGDVVVVDGDTGRVIARPSAREVENERRRERSRAALERAWLRHAVLPAETRDGRRVRLCGNVDSARDLEALARHGARGVGLFRTEFLYLNRSTPPDEEEQFRHYRAVVLGARPDPAVIRTLDLGADKVPAGLPRRSEANPALGLRGIRVSLARPEILRVQLRAMLRAAAHGRLRILIPMVSGIEEIRRTRELLEDVRLELEGSGAGLASSVELGAMVETPAAAAVADALALEVDFLSIGTNDLIQYTVAVDRENESVAYLYDGLHPAVLRAVRGVVDAAHAAGRPVAVCGELAADPAAAVVLVGLGVDELSMQAPAIPRVKARLRAVSLADARSLAGGLLALPTAREVGDRLGKAFRGSN
ncbi:Phosphoenolpyruvate-protein phosphotransferase [Myxococcaceae bacterium]|jgi:phosphotransferase system enzyme I (PtsI)|nr:Phosphoenolpyruvate-protein phosphotransferase [Myxococcaceae bacterium]